MKFELSGALPLQRSFIRLSTSKGRSNRTCSNHGGDDCADSPPPHRLRTERLHPDLRESSDHAFKNVASSAFKQSGRATFPSKTHATLTGPRRSPDEWRWAGAWGGATWRGARRMGRGAVRASAPQSLTSSRLSDRNALRAWREFRDDAPRPMRCSAVREADTRPGAPPQAPAQRCASGVSPPDHPRPARPSRPPWCGSPPCRGGIWCLPACDPRR